MSRAYKHGADYVHIAMHFDDSEIEQLKPVLANIRANFVNGSYIAPSRQQPISENIVPKYSPGTGFSPMHGRTMEEVTGPPATLTGIHKHDRQRLLGKYLELQPIKSVRL